MVIRSPPPKLPPLIVFIFMFKPLYFWRVSWWGGHVCTGRLCDHLMKTYLLGAGSKPNPIAHCRRQWAILKSCQLRPGYFVFYWHPALCGAESHLCFLLLAQLFFVGIWAECRGHLLIGVCHWLHDVHAAHCSWHGGISILRCGFLETLMVSIRRRNGKHPQTDPQILTYACHVNISFSMLKWLGKCVMQNTDSQNKASRLNRRL